MLEINYTKSGLGEINILIVPVWADYKTSPLLSEEVTDTINALIEQGEFKAKLGETRNELVDTDSGIIKLVAVGLGEKAKSTPERMKIAGAKAYMAVGNASDKNIGIVLDDKIINSAGQLKFLEGFALRNYLDDKYKTGESKLESEAKIIEELTLIGNFDTNFKDALERVLIITEGTHDVRDLVAAPPSDIKPEDLANFAEEIADAYDNVEATILNKADLEKEKMNLLLAVSRGSINEPRLIVLTLNPDKKEDPIVLIGKGVTFDSGGYDLKPETGMRDMHCDMAGAATVLSTVATLAALGEKRKVIAIAPSTENLVNGEAYKPSDIITSHAGLTVEIDNTDAEGRLILADAISYAKRFNPAVIIDLATLTGAAIVALGEKYSAVFSNRPELIKSLQKASDISGDKIWPLPLDDSFREKMKSKLADIGNLAKGLDRKAGSSTGAAFLEFFVGDIPWAHLDIAGPAFQSIEIEAWNPPSGATGYGVSLLVEAVENQL